MHLALRSLALLGLLVGAARADITRTLTETFTVEPGPAVSVDLASGPIRVTVGEPGTVRVELEQRVKASSERAADEVLAGFTIAVTQEDSGVKLVVRRNRSGGWSRAERGVRFAATLVVPPDVNLSLDTAGGAIAVDGEIDGRLHADTSGGAIKVTGGRGHLNLDTSGGSISVQRALGHLHADTSGGSISIAYVGPQASEINADTSGGSIRIGVDPAGNFDLTADTSGGGVRVEDLTFAASKQTRTHATGRINAGGARLRADTSGGSIVIRAARP